MNRRKNNPEPGPANLSWPVGRQNIRSRSFFLIALVLFVALILTLNSYLIGGYSLVKAKEITSMTLASAQETKRQPIPAIDANAPVAYETATFAMG